MHNRVFYFLFAVGAIVLLFFIGSARGADLIVPVGGGQDATADASYDDAWVDSTFWMNEWDIWIDGDLVINATGSWDGNASASLTVNGSVTVNGELTLDTGDMIVVGDTTINNGGTLGTAGWTGTFTTSRLIIYAGGTYQATSSETVITGALHNMLYNLGDIVHNQGTFNFTGANGHYMSPGSSDDYLYDVIISCPLIRITQTGGLNYLNVEDDLIINSGSTFTYHSAGASMDQTVNGTTVVNGTYIPSPFADNHYGVVVVNGTMGAAICESDWSMSSLTINSGGVMTSTSGTLTINTLFENDGTLTPNGGTLQFSDCVYTDNSDTLLNNVIIDGYCNATTNLFILGTVTMTGADTLILSGNGSYIEYRDTGLFYTFYPGNNTYTNIIQYNGSYEINNISNDKLYFSCDNYRIYGAFDETNFDVFGYVSFFNVVCEWLNFSSNSIIESKFIGYTKIYNGNIRSFNQTFSWGSDHPSTPTEFYDTIIFYNVSSHGKLAIEFLDVYDLYIKGIFSTHNSSVYFSSNLGNITITPNGRWELNNRLRDITVYDFVVHGELRFLNYTTQAYYFSSTINKFGVAILNPYAFYNSTGEINITADISNPFYLAGDFSPWPDATNNRISLSNLSDYYFKNVEFYLLNNTETEYITADGVGENLIGNWDFDPPLIALVDLINNTVFVRNAQNMINLSVYFEELSYFHSYYLQVLDPNGYIIFEKSVNLSSPLNSTYEYRLLNVTTYINGKYTYNIFCNDTHNKINKLDTYKTQKAKNLKISCDDKEDKIGYYDTHKLKTNGKNLYVTDYVSDSLIYWIEFENKGDHEITYNVRDLNFKILHNMRVKNNAITFKICSSYPIQYFEKSYYAGHFIINQIYAYDMQDFENMGGEISVSHLMKTKDYDYYEVTLIHPDMIDGENFEIDPLSMVVNSNFSVVYFYVIGDSVIYGNVTIDASPEYEGITSNYTIDISLSGVNITKYIFISSIDGEFYNHSALSFDNNNLSVGTHTIYLYVITDIGDYLLLRTLEHIVFPIPQAKINYVNIEGSQITISGGYVQIANNTIYRYCWRTNVTGTFYNSTGNPITLISLTPGDYTLYLKIMDENGIWSNEANTTFSITNVTVENALSNWWVNADSFIIVSSMIIIIIVGIVFITYVFYKTSGGLWSKFGKFDFWSK